MTQKSIARALNVSARTIRNALPIDWATRRSVFLKQLVGSHRVHAAHAILDLWELVHVVVAERRHPTLADLAKIRGECVGGSYVAQDEASTVRAFYRIQSLLEAWGVRFEKRVVEGETSTRIEFDRRQLASFVRREVGLAGRVVDEFAERTGEARRFRGR